MEIHISNETLFLNLYGFGGVAINKDYAKTGFELMNKMWKTVNEKKLKHKGINFWVYENNEQMFAGVELFDSLNENDGLEAKSVHLIKYAYYNHIGPYHLIKDIGEKIKNELNKQGLRTTFPYIEKYGHWAKDENKLQTELLYSLL